MASASASPKQKVHIDPALRTYQLAEKKYQDTRSSALALYFVGIVLFYICLLQFFLLLSEDDLFPHILILSVSGLGSLILIIAGNRSLKYSHELKALADEERELANELIEWFVTTYSIEQIDHQIEAITTMSGSPEILCLKRLDMIRILVTREYPRNLDEEFLSQLCEDLFHMLYESPAPM